MERGTHMRNMRYTQYVQEMEKKRKARKLTTQEVIALTLVIAAFAYIIFGLLNNNETDYYDSEYTEPLSEGFNSADIDTVESYDVYYEELNSNND